MLKQFLTQTDLALPKYNRICEAESNNIEHLLGKSDYTVRVMFK